MAFVESAGECLRLPDPAVSESRRESLAVFTKIVVAVYDDELKSALVVRVLAAVLTFRVRILMEGARLVALAR